MTVAPNSMPLSKNPRTIHQNPHLIAAMRDYKNALRMVRCGLLGNAHSQRKNLLIIYRLIAGKSLPSPLSF